MQRFEILSNHNYSQVIRSITARHKLVTQTWDAKIWFEILKNRYKKCVTTIEVWPLLADWWLNFKTCCLLYPIYYVCSPVLYGIEQSLGDLSSKNSTDESHSKCSRIVCHIQEIPQYHENQWFWWNFIDFHQKYLYFCDKHDFWITGVSLMQFWNTLNDSHLYYFC